MDWTALYFCHALPRGGAVGLLFCASLVALLVLLFRMVQRTASEYFEVILTAVSRDARIPPRLAAVTLLALGNGAPDLGAAVVAVKAGKVRLALGGLTGAAMIVSCVASGRIVASRGGVRARAAQIRDVLALLVGVLAVGLVALRGSAGVATALFLLALYMGYCCAVYCADYVRPHWKRAFSLTGLYDAASDDEDARRATRGGGGPGGGEGGSPGAAQAEAEGVRLLPPSPDRRQGPQRAETPDRRQGPQRAGIPRGGATRAPGAPSGGSLSGQGAGAFPPPRMALPLSAESPPASADSRGTPWAPTPAGEGSAAARGGAGPPQASPGSFVRTVSGALASAAAAALAAAGSAAASVASSRSATRTSSPSRDRALAARPPIRPGGASASELAASLIPEGDEDADLVAESSEETELLPRGNRRRADGAQPTQLATAGRGPARSRAFPPPAAEAASLGAAIPGAARAREPVTPTFAHLPSVPTTFGSPFDARAGGGPFPFGHLDLQPSGLSRGAAAQGAAAGYLPPGSSLASTASALSSPRASSDEGGASQAAWRPGAGGGDGGGAGPERPPGSSPSGRPRAFPPPFPPPPPPPRHRPSDPFISALSVPPMNAWPTLGVPPPGGRGPGAPAPGPWLPPAPSGLPPLPPAPSAPSPDQRPPGRGPRWHGMSRLWSSRPTSPPTAVAMVRLEPPVARFDPRGISAWQYRLQALSQMALGSPDAGPWQHVHFPVEDAERWPEIDGERSYVPGQAEEEGRSRMLEAMAPERPTGGAVGDEEPGPDQETPRERAGTEEAAARGEGAHDLGPLGGDRDAPSPWSPALGGDRGDRHPLERAPAPSALSGGSSRADSQEPSFALRAGGAPPDEASALVSPAPSFPHVQGRPETPTSIGVGASRAFAEAARAPPSAEGGGGPRGASLLSVGGGPRGASPPPPRAASPSSPPLRSPSAARLAKAASASPQAGSRQGSPMPGRAASAQGRLSGAFASGAFASGAFLPGAPSRGFVSPAPSRPMTPVLPEGLDAQPPAHLIGRHVMDPWSVDAAAAAAAGGVGEAAASVWGRRAGLAASVAEAPFALMLHLTVPMVEQDAYSREWFVASVGLAPMFLALYASDGLVPSASGFFAAAFAGASLAALALAATEGLPPGEPPTWPLPSGLPLGSLLVSLCSFVIGALWIAAFADEIVSLVHFFGLVGGADDAILGVTVLAWGNSVTDLLTNHAVAARSAAGTAMAMTACYAGPLFNILCSLGLGFLWRIHAVGGAVTVAADPVVVVGIVGIIAQCAATVAVAVRNGFTLPERYGTAMLAWYAVYLVVAVAMVKLYGTDREE